MFSLSLGDWLDPEVPIEWLADMLDVIRRCPNLDFLLLTKRPELWNDRLTELQDTFPRSATIPMETVDWVNAWQDNRPPANVWVGVSVENQAMADFLNGVPREAELVVAGDLPQEVRVELGGLALDLLFLMAKLLT